MQLKMEAQRFVKFCLLLVLFLNIVELSSAKFVITSKEIKAIEEFRPLVKDLITHNYQTTDGYLVLWLRAKKLNVKEAVQLFTELNGLRIPEEPMDLILRKPAQQWRKKNNIDSIVDEKFPEFESLERSFTSDGVDYEGRTVFTISIGNFDFRRLILAGKLSRVQRFSQQAMEKAASLAAQRAFESNGTLVDPRIVSIADLAGFSLAQVGCLSCINYFAANQRDLGSNYPGIAGLSIHINVPPIALPFVQTIESIIPEENRANVKVFGTDRAEWMKYLQTIIAPDQLRGQFGGTKADK